MVIEAGEVSIMTSTTICRLNGYVGVRGTALVERAIHSDGTQSTLLGVRCVEYSTHHGTLHRSTTSQGGAFRDGPSHQLELHVIAVGEAYYIRTMLLRQYSNDVPS